MLIKNQKPSALERDCLHAIFCCTSTGNHICREHEVLREEMSIMKKMLGILVAVIAFAVSSLACADSVEKAQATSAWTNQRGSTLYIDNIGNNGQITGRYVNRAPGYGCQNIPYPVTGWVYGNAITFTVIWRGAESCNSITAWTGFIAAGKMQTLWQLVVNGSTNTGQIKQGADTFLPVMVQNRKSILNEK